MHTFGLLWLVFVRAGVGARLVIVAVVLLAAAGVQRVLLSINQFGYWLDARYDWAARQQRRRLRARGRCEVCAGEPAAVLGVSWRIWRARVHRREIAPGVHVVCPDGAHGIVVDVLRCGWGPVCCPLAALVSIEQLGEAPRVVELSRLLPIDGELAAELDEVSGL